MLTDEIQRYVIDLCSRFSEVRAVWLIGSRAIGTARDTSDWDLLVFGSRAVLRELRANEDFRRPEVDLLVIYDSDNFERPWADTRGGGSLSGWNWMPVSETKAAYRAAKPVYASDGTEEFNVQITQGEAIRIWPHDNE